MESQLVPSSDPQPTGGAVTKPQQTGPVVLIVDDARVNRLHVANLLAPTEARTLLAEDGFQAYKLLRTTPIDLVVCDLNMPRCDGLQFLRLKASDPALEAIPVIVLTGTDDGPGKVRALSSGASDYVTKPFDDAELLARVRVHLKLRRLQCELLAANAELERQTRIDGLTDVSNRRHFDLVVDEELVRARRYERPLSVIMLDIDHFKRVNDERGHQGGDAALIAVGKVCKRVLRRHDTIARYGGEEFAIVLPETAHEGAAQAAERLRAAIASEVISFHGASFSVTVSLGVATFPHDLAGRADELVALADAALYDAKRSGRNRVMAAV